MWHRTQATGQCLGVIHCRTHAIFCEIGASLGASGHRIHGVCGQCGCAIREHAVCTAALLSAIGSHNQAVMSVLGALTDRTHKRNNPCAPACAPSPLATQETRVDQSANACPHGGRRQSHAARVDGRQVVIAKFDVAVASLRGQHDDERIGAVVTIAEALGCPCRQGERKGVTHGAPPVRAAQTAHQFGPLAGLGRAAWQPAICPRSLSARAPAAIQPPLRWSDWREECAGNKAMRNKCSVKG